MEQYGGANNSSMVMTELSVALKEDSPSLLCILPKTVALTLWVQNKFSLNLEVNPLINFQLKINLKD